MSDLISVADALALAEVQAGDPELIAGAQGLDREIRWAHVVAGSAAVGLLDGGELVLTTGAGWPREGDELARLSAALIDTGPAAVVIELGRFFTEPPAPLRAVCEEHGIPLIALHHEVRFVQITQRVHQRILAAQTEALAARAEVHAMLTELGLNRSPVDYVIERLADTLGTAVVLEDSSRRVVAWAGRPTAQVRGRRADRPPPGSPTRSRRGPTPTAPTSPRSTAGSACRSRRRVGAGAGSSRCPAPSTRRDGAPCSNSAHSR